MTFSQQLNEYLDLLNCTGRELADASHISPSLLSRYRSGTRIPRAGSQPLTALAQAIAALSAGTFTADSVLAALTATLDAADAPLPPENLDALILALGINLSSLARATGYDASYISRIRSGQRRPQDSGAFIDAVSRFVAEKYTAPGDLQTLAALTGSSAEALSDRNVLIGALRQWLCYARNDRADSLGHFLTKLDAFDLNDYIRAIHFDELKVPTVPFRLPTAKSYIGLKEMRQGELDFFRATVLAPGGESVFMCSDMDVADMAEDGDFAKKWMFAIAMCLKKGLHLDMIHTVDRPFAEMMLGLEGWIPIYMTGQVSPYYLKNARSGVYQHLNYVSGAAALTGECIAGHHGDGRYALTKKPEEVAYYRRKSQYILKKALPLMEILRRENAPRLRSFLAKDAAEPGVRHGILSAPPLYTIPEELFRTMLTRSGIAAPEQEALWAYVQTLRQDMEQILQENPVLDELPQLTPEEFVRYPVYLPLEGAFFEGDIPYTYGEYTAHLAAARAFAESHPNYQLQTGVRSGFRHIQIFIHEGQFALISKGKSPAVHFIIRHDALREAIENFILPMAEEA